MMDASRSLCALDRCRRPALHSSGVRSVIRHSRTNLCLPQLWRPLEITTPCRLQAKLPRCVPAGDRALGHSIRVTEAVFGDSARCCHLMTAIRFRVFFLCFVLFRFFFFLLVQLRIANLGGGDRVVFVDDRNRAERQQVGKGRPGVQMAAAFFRIVLGQEDLRDGDAVAGEGLLVSVGEADLSGGCGGLLLLEPQPPSGEPEMPPPDCNCPRRDEDHLLAARSKTGDIIGERTEPWLADLAIFGR